MSGPVTFSVRLLMVCRMIDDTFPSGPGAALYCSWSRFACAISASRAFGPRAYRPVRGEQVRVLLGRAKIVDDAVAVLQFHDQEPVLRPRWPRAVADTSISDAARNSDRVFRVEISSLASFPLSISAHHLRQLHTLAGDTHAPAGSSPV